MNNPSLAITGSTGHVGGLVAGQLAREGIALRLLSRNPHNAPTLGGAVAIQSSYANDDATRASLAGVDVLFMVSGSESADRLDQHRAFIDAAVSAGVGHIVYTSFAGATRDAIFTLARDHWATEQHILGSGISHTFLRNNFYIDVLPEFVGEDDVLRAPASHGRLAAVTRADVARVAAAVLKNPAAHANVTYTLTGPQAPTLSEVTQTISEVSGRSVTYHDESVEEAYASRRRWEAPQWQYDAWVSTYTAIAAGDFERVTNDVRTVTGNGPESLRQYLQTRH
ncbi:SDR family oxidoreductase [Mycobacterium sp. CBMA271]|uniref:SDR family oxidoreductase n=1 Tax=unclassified Mycobacteroides TaxID=2618759 RepID=UPI0012DE8193|nr:MULTISPECIES: SDR family oxidoreductase [unclassified Mycobacteroides]MUM18869.1 NAD(P)-dependent oxidoreductase [Mycobacteroides sp. CBMA 326]MUM23191.1 SDR family oxidoreductase [Mycobacteroides sp. CBMA 271]